MFTEAKAVEYLRKKVGKMPEMLVILGSGWNKVLEGSKVETEISYKDLFGFEASVPGHDGKLVVAEVAQKRVAFMAGRPHAYEGYSTREATLPIRVFAKGGTKKVVITAACGALNEHYKVGDFVVLSDVLTLFMALDNPLVGPDFVDMSEVFEPTMRRVALEACVGEKIAFHEGTYVYYHGPNYESPADKMALRHLGGDVVGMSTVPETIMSRSLGLSVLGLAFVTNLAFVKHDHKEVVSEANKASGKMVGLLSEIIKKS